MIYYLFRRCSAESKVFWRNIFYKHSKTNIYFISLCILLSKAASLKMEQHTFRRRGLGLRAVDDDKVSPGYVLYAPLTSQNAYIVSTSGEKVHQWTLPYRVGRHARILPNGNLAYNGVHPEPPERFPMWAKYRGGVMLQVSPGREVLREYRDPKAHHDQHHLGNEGDTLLYATLEPLTGEESKRVQGGISGSEATSEGLIYGDCIKLVEPWTTSNTSSSADFEEGQSGGAKLLWSWRAIDHLDPALFPLHGHYPREHWPLINSVSLGHNGDIIASLRSTSSVIVISRKTGEVIWHLSAPVVSQQHCATELLPSDNLLILDNGVFRPGVSVPFSRVIIVSRETKQVVWEYHDRSTGGLGFFTPFMGSAQRLKGGSIFVCEAASGRVFEITDKGEIVWEYVVPELSDYKNVMAEEELKQVEKMGFAYQSNAIFRAYKYAPEEIPWLQQPPREEKQ